MKSQTRPTRESPTRGATEFLFSSSASYADKDEYVAKNLSFTIDRIVFEEKAGFNGGNRWAITVSPDDGRPAEIVTLQSNEKRDALLEAALSHIAAHGPIRHVRLVKSGKAYYFSTVAEAKLP